MMKSRVEKIRERNAEAALEMPFNYCDRWCARCGVTDRCRVYQEEMNEKLNQMADGKDPESLECVMESVKKSTRKSVTLIRKWAKEEGIDLRADPFDEEEIKLAKLRSRKLRTHSLSRLSYAFCEQAYTFLKRYYYRKSPDYSVDHLAEYQTLEWYHTLLPVKIHRLLGALYSGKEEWNDPIMQEALLSDAVAQMDICRKAITLSQAACDQLTLPHPMELVPFAKMRTFLGKIEEGLKIIEEQIDLGCLPLRLEDSYE